MKYLFALILLLGNSVSHGQQKQEDSIQSRFLNTTIPFTVYIPANRDTTQSLPVIYSFNYGMVSGAYIAAQLDYFQSANYTLPHSILVNISANMDRIGFIYASGQLTPTGRQMVECLKKEIIPLVEKKYHTASFRSYLGHSFAASYGNYLIQYEPGLFNGYMLLAPEKIAPEQPPFTLTPALRDWYNKHYTFYYAAVGEHDLARRAAYPREVTDQLKQLDSTRMYARYDSIPGGDHSNIVSLTIQSALEHLYQLYNPYLDAGHPADVVKELHETIDRVGQVYGITPQKEPGVL
ncbi:alpha/beta hydrolase-fold protein [Paraflavitalea speifideaquila]|uniref:alpha/beta hydrolase-fold protein n=1 Tax=Paraflavitalea speifideaquila TaxID=3076558 RepID=UPI0028EA3570|nr:alpha/beta hydrolase-fold protein [Paraflavitalea speifideiaquila]